MQSYADKVIAMVESDKVGIYGGMSLFELDELDMLITGKDAPADMIDLLRSKNVDVHLV